MDKKPIKEKVKAKAKAVKEKLKGGKAKKAVSLAFLCAFCALAGCMTPGQASRGTSNNEGDVEPTVKVCIGDNSHSNTVVVTQTITHGDGAIASADSSGSSESQTQTPTFDISPKTDLHYNDALKNATDASRGGLEKLTDSGAQAVLKMMAGKESGTVKVEQKDGTTATVECKDGQCSICTDGSCSP
jgi:hypothetical protein